VPSARGKRSEVTSRVDAIVGRAMAKRPRDRYPSMEAMAAALEAALAEGRLDRRPDRDEDTGVLPRPPAAEKPRPPLPRSGKPRWRIVVILLLATAALVAGLVAAETGRDGGLLPGEGGGNASGVPVRLQAVSDYDPDGDGTEHPEDVPAATDGNTSTYWTTESYGSFSKPGVGIVLEAPEATALSRIVVLSDEPGFTARIRASSSEDGGFVDVSEEQTVAARTAFSLDTGGKDYRYYLVWITDPNGRAHVNEVRARAG
jgi:eukaryotic-like serine/threonine-protein kinase